MSILDEHFLSDEQARWALFSQMSTQDEAEMSTFFQMSKQDEHLFYRWVTQMSTFSQMNSWDEHLFLDEQVTNQFNLII